MRRQGRLRRSCDLQQDHIIFILDDFSAAAKHLNPLPFWKGSPGMVSITPVKGWSMTCSNLYVEVVTSSTLECDFIWIWRYCRHNDVRRKMRQPLIQCDLCPCKKGKSEDRNHIQGERHVKIKAEIGVTCLQVKECQRLTMNHQVPGKIAK